jgi:hypothetical protein
MIRVTPKAVEKLKETLEYPKRDLLRSFIAGVSLLY